MSLVGNLEDLGLGEILQIVSLSRRSGVLSLESRGRQARVYFRNGKVIRAVSSSYQRNMGEVLIQQGVLDLATLKSALKYQSQEGQGQLLGGIMIDRFGVSADAIEEVVREQIEHVVYSPFVWDDGVFEFELQEVAEIDAASLDPVQFMLKQGLNPQYLAMEGSRMVDEERHRAESGDGGECPPAEPEGTLDFAFDLLQEQAPGQAAGIRPDGPEQAPLARPLADAVPAGAPLMLVDDDPTTLEALATLLERQGYRVHAVGRSEEALIRLDTLYRDGVRPTLLVDLIMPRMDGTGILGGLELMELVKSNFPDLPVLALSDFPNEDARRKMLAMGIKTLRKPLRGQLPEALDEFGPKLLAEIPGLPAFSGEPAAPSGEPAALFGAGPVFPRTAPVLSGVGATVFDAPAAGSVNLGDDLRRELGEEPARREPDSGRGNGRSRLGGMLEELNRQQLGGGIMLLVLRFAAEFVNRAVVLLVREQGIHGLGQFGIDDRDGSADLRVRALRIPKGEPSLFSAVLESRCPLKGGGDDSRWSGYFLDQLGGARPGELFLAPIVSEGRVVALLYGDNLPGGEPIGDTEALEIFLGQAGIAMEKALLQRRLQERGRGEM